MVFAVSAADGVKIAVMPSQAIEPPTAVNPAATVNVLELIVEQIIALLNVAATEVSVGTPLAPFAGKAEVTIGGTISRGVITT